MGTLAATPLAAGIYANVAEAGRYSTPVATGAANTIFNTSGTLGAVSATAGTQQTHAATLDDLWRSNLAVETGLTLGTTYGQYQVSSPDTLSAANFDTASGVGTFLIDGSDLPGLPGGLSYQSAPVTYRHQNTVNATTAGNSANLSAFGLTAIAVTPNFNNGSLQDNAPVPTDKSTYTAFSGVGGSTTTPNSILFDFTGAFGGGLRAFGAFFGDLESSGPSPGRGGLQARVILFDAAGNNLGGTSVGSYSNAQENDGDIVSVNDFDAPVGSGGLLGAGGLLGDGTTRWLGFTGTSLVARMLVIVGDDDKITGIDGGSEQLSFLGGTAPLLVVPEISHGLAATLLTVGLFFLTGRGRVRRQG